MSELGGRSGHPDAPGPRSTRGEWLRRRLTRLAAYRWLADARLRSRSTEHVFSDIVAGNKWRGSESLSGPGSSAEEVQVVIAALPGLLRELGVRTLLDVPCGDFNWMRHVDLDGIEYTGADIVNEVLVAANAFARSGVAFRRLDLLTEPLPAADLVLCRDGLVHFSDRDVFAALRNICVSGSRYLLTTTFTSRTVNTDIVTGRWRPLNLELAPFGLPPPIRTISEGSTAGHGAYADKSLGLWRTEEIAPVLALR